MGRLRQSGHRSGNVNLSSVYDMTLPGGNVNADPAGREAMQFNRVDDPNLSHAQPFGALPPPTTSPGFREQGVELIGTVLTLKITTSQKRQAVPRRARISGS